MRRCFELLDLIGVQARRQDCFDCADQLPYVAQDYAVWSWLSESESLE